MGLKSANVSADRPPQLRRIMNASLTVRRIRVGWGPVGVKYDNGRRTMAGANPSGSLAALLASSTTQKARGGPAATRPRRPGAGAEVWQGKPNWTRLCGQDEKGCGTRNTSGAQDAADCRA